MEDKNYNFKAGEILLIDKPFQWTSFRVVDRVRRYAKAKVGHAGTLDPLATGLLVLATGKFTKKLQEFQNLDKEYIGTFTLGGTTPSYDLETEITERFDISHITEEMIKAATAEFTGTIDQVPPVFSAIKVNGEKLYNKARANETVEVPVRKVHIHSFEITNIDLPEIEFKVHCSKGTYIRSLAHDFGKALGAGAHLSGLRRTRIGSFNIEEAWNLKDFINFAKTIRRDANPPGH